MRMGIVPAFCFSLSLICCPRPAAAQSNLVSSQPPQVPLSSQPSPAKPSEALTDTKASIFWLSALAAKEQTKPQQYTSVYVYPPKDGTSNLQTLPSVEASQCAHITIFQAPETDSEIIINKTPKNLDSTDKPPGIYKALPPCSRDFQTPLMVQGLPKFPKEMKIPANGVIVVPKKDAPTPNLKIPVDSPKP